MFVPTKLSILFFSVSVKNIYWINCMSYNNSTYIGIRKQVMQHLYKLFSLLFCCYDQISFVSQPCICPGVIMQWWCEISCIFSFPKYCTCLLITIWRFVYGYRSLIGPFLKELISLFCVFVLVTKTTFNLVCFTTNKSSWNFCVVEFFCFKYWHKNDKTNV